MVGCPSQITNSRKAIKKLYLLSTKKVVSGTKMQGPDGQNFSGGKVKGQSQDGWLPFPTKDSQKAIK